MSGHTSLRYFSRYLGKRVAKDDSSRRRPPGRVSPDVSSQGLMDQWSMSGLSHGLSRRYLLWFLGPFSVDSTMLDILCCMIYIYMFSAYSIGRVSIQFIDAVRWLCCNLNQLTTISLLSWLLCVCSSFDLSGCDGRQKRYTSRLIRQTALDDKSGSPFSLLAHRKSEFLVP